MVCKHVGDLHVVYGRLVGGRVYALRGSEMEAERGRSSTLFSDASDTTGLIFWGRTFRRTSRTFTSTSSGNRSWHTW